MTQAATVVVVLGTGGTIAGSAGDAATNVGYRAGVIGIDALVAGLGPNGIAVETEQVAQLDSKDMDAATWRQLGERVAQHARREAVRGIVVTHGTDTLEETAWWLARTAAGEGKPVVLTGAMRPASSRLADGPQNLADALAVAALPGASGVVAVMAGALHGARDVRKAHPYRLDAFTSGDSGPVGYIEEGRLRQVRGWPAPASAAVSVPDDPAAWPRVEIVSSHAGADGRIVGLLVDDGVAGIVVAATGNGDIHQALEAALRDALRRGVGVLCCARGDGAIVDARAGAAIAGARGAAASVSAFESAGGLTPGKARVELIVRLFGSGLHRIGR